MADDVALDFRRARFNRIAARAQVAVRPRAVIDGVPIRGFELPVRTQEFLRDLLQALVQLAPEDLLNRSFGPRHTGVADAAERAHLVGAHDLYFSVALRELLADQRILGRRATAAFDRPRQLDQPVDVALIRDLPARPERAALV